MSQSRQFSLLFSSCCCCVLDCITHFFMLRPGSERVGARSKVIQSAKVREEALFHEVMC